MMKSCFLVYLFSGFLVMTGQSQLVATGKTTFPIQHAVILTDTADFTLIQRSAALLQQDIENISGYRPRIIHTLDKPYANIIVIGTITPVRHAERTGS